MPGVAEQHLKIVTKGTIMGSQTWSTAFWVRPVLVDGTWGVANANAFAQGMDTLIATWWSALASFASVQTTRVGTDVYEYAPGSATAGLQGNYTLATASAGTGVGSCTSVQALVASLRSATPGRRGRGRSFFPANAISTATNHQLTSGNVITVATAYANLLSSMLAYNNVPANISSLQPIVRSVAGNASHLITSVVVDSRFDTIRARNAKLTPLSRSVKPVE